MNKVQLTGRLLADPDTRKTNKGLTIVSFRIASQRKYKNKKGMYDSDFISCKAFGSVADFIEQYFKKGEPIEVSGRIETGSYENNNGDRVYTTSVVCEEVGFTLSRPKHSQSENIYYDDTKLPFEL